VYVSFLEIVLKPVAHMGGCASQIVPNTYSEKEPAHKFVMFALL